MQYWITLVLILIISQSPVLAFAEEEAQSTMETLVVTATRVETPAEEIGSSFTVITEEEIEKKQKTSVLEVLRTVPGLDVVQSGGLGKTASVFIRGANSEHTLVLIDGIQMNDPISAGRAFDFADLTTTNVERIEIIRGPQSTLYGSDAIGGVINIITKKGKGKPTANASAEAGSYHTLIGKAGINGSNKLINYSLGVSHAKTDGVSIANEKDGNTEKDGYENTTVSTRLGVTPVEYCDLDFIFRYIDAGSDLDNSGGVGGDDPNYVYDSKTIFFRTQANLSLFSDFWDQTLGVSISDHDRSYKNDPDADHPDDLERNTFDSQILKFDWQHNLYVHETNTITLGVETEEEKGKTYYYSESSYGPYESIFAEKSARTTGYYLQDQISLFNSWFTTVGLRVDDHENFGTETTYRIASSYLLDKSGTNIKGSYGTGFKAPSLYQLYSSYGNENLDPEETKGWDLGLEQSIFGEKVKLGATYFSNEFDNMIDFDYSTYKYGNIAEAETNGVETFIALHPRENLTLQCNYTYTETEDKTTREALLRRPKNKVGLDTYYSPHEKVGTYLGIVYVGKRDEMDFSTYPSTRIELDSYVLVNLAAAYQITKRVQIFGRVDNLFDEEYQEVNGYGTPGVSGFGGVKVSL